DLQDDLHPSTEAGELDDLPATLSARVLPPEPCPPVSDPDDAPLERAHAVLAAHPVADGYSGLPWVLKHLPWYDLEIGESAVDTDVPRLREGYVGALLASLHLPEGIAADRAVGATL
ncbi:dipeptidase, partial [Streptomyces sp. TRM76130]|nr:dipeptidase [Streptomyces sp. TRM76130]